MLNLHYIKKNYYCTEKITNIKSYQYTIIRSDLNKLHVAGVMYNVFCQKLQISIRTIHEFSIAITREFVLLASRCMKPYVDFLITASKFWILLLAYIALALHRQGKFSTRR